MAKGTALTQFADYYNEFTSLHPQTSDAELETIFKERLGYSPKRFKLNLGSAKKLNLLDRYRQAESVEEFTATIEVDITDTPDYTLNSLPTDSLFWAGLFHGLGEVSQRFGDTIEVIANMKTTDPLLAQAFHQRYGGFPYKVNGYTSIQLCQDDLGITQLFADLKHSPKWKDVVEPLEPYLEALAMLRIQDQAIRSKVFKR